MRQPIIISACLAGLRTRYDGREFPHPQLAELSVRWTLVPVCPEVLGGLGIPRPQCRFTGGDGVGVLEGMARIVDRTGRDRTAHFVRGGEEVERVVRLVTPRLIVFKEGSPSCGVRRVDIEGTKQPGCGVTVALLRRQGFSILTEEDPVEAYDRTST